MFAWAKTVFMFYISNKVDNVLLYKYILTYLCYLTYVQKNTYKNNLRF